MLVSALVGIDTISTMDLDTTLNKLPLTESHILKAFKSICIIDLNDHVDLKIISIQPNQKNTKYGGFCVRIDASCDSIITPLSIDISTGDVITPKAISYNLQGIFDEDLKIKVWAYNVETLLAEKVETILSRSIFNTRIRDYYDVYILSTTQVYDSTTFKEALFATATFRNSIDKVMNAKMILDNINENTDLMKMWNKYQNKFQYAQNISYQQLMVAFKALVFDEMKLEKFT